jgi:2-polyprenyl-3-methyl-5-hydroxy-6-metoxy-1,4-benzoquinol methylase
MKNTNNFYSKLTPLYHLIYPDWERSIKRQAETIDTIIKERFGGVQDVLDVSCGIGTQALGLAAIGYNVTASDLSVDEITRATQEARDRNLTINFSVADM